MTMQEGSRALGEGAATRQRQDRAYFLDLMGDSLGGLGRYEAAIDAYRQAAQAFEAQGARCSYALCLFKIADSHLSLQEPWHAIGYLQACLPLLRELGLVRHAGLAQRKLAACQAGLAQAGLPGPRRRRCR
jgi:tetratricopeptide (TPR) repeat protein